MLKITQISPRGQITIPAWMRRHFTLNKERQVLLWPRIEADEIVIKPLVKQDLSELRGSVKPKRKPENWSQVRKEVKKKMARRIASA